MRVHFSQFETEEDFDYVYILDGSNTVVASYTGTKIPFWSDEVDGNTIKIRLVTDFSNTAYGFDIDKYTYPTPQTPPSNLTKGDVVQYGWYDSDWYLHSAIVVGGSGNSVYCNCHTADDHHFSWADKYNQYPAYFTIAHFYHIPDWQGWQPDLEPKRPSDDWEQALVVSKEPGNHIHDSVLPINQTYYIDFCIENTGSNDVPDEVKATLYMDGNGRFGVRSCFLQE